jgi:SAM-dependent methyltransferase
VRAEAHREAHRSFFTGPYHDVQRQSWTAEATEQHVAVVEKTLGLAPGSRILDAPCGTGRLTIPLARRHSMTGVDITAVYLEGHAGPAATARVEIAFLERDTRELDGSTSAAGRAPVTSLSSRPPLRSRDVTGRIDWTFLAGSLVEHKHWAADHGSDLGLGMSAAGTPRDRPLMLVEASLRARRFRSTHAGLLGLGTLSAVTCTAEAPLSTGAAEQAAITPPLPDLVMALHAKTTVTIGPSSFVFGDVASSGPSGSVLFDVGSGQDLFFRVLSNTIRIRTGASVGRLIGNDIINDGSATGTTLGFDPAAMPAIPAVTTATPGTTNVSTNANQTKQLCPGPGIPFFACSTHPARRLRPMTTRAAAS